MNNDGREELYEMIEDIGTAMLVTEKGNDLRSRPMTSKLYRHSGEIWVNIEPFPCPRHWPKRASLS